MKSVASPVGSDKLKGRCWTVMILATVAHAHKKPNLLSLIGQRTPSFNVPSGRSTILMLYMGTGFRTSSCFILNKFTKINIKPCGDDGKTQC